MSNGKAYYNEIDQFAVKWLRNLIAEGLIAPGDVDDRPIQEVKPDDLKGYTQYHFFAGIAGWSYALRLAGWPDDQPVWTGSCPCQPFSSAGRRQGSADERHLWPAFFNLIAECRPATIFGEQVAGKLGLEWITAVRLDLESIGYACGAADLPASCVGAPHRRQRIFWLADSSGGRQRNEESGIGSEADRGRSASNSGDTGGNGRMADTGRIGEGSEETREDLGGPENSRGTDVHAGERGKNNSLTVGHTPSGGTEPRSRGSEGPEETESRGNGSKSGAKPSARSDGAPDKSVGNAKRKRPSGPASERQGRKSASAGSVMGDPHGTEETRQRRVGIPLESEQEAGRPGYANPWQGIEFVGCADGKARPVKPGILPLAHGVPGRVGQIRAYGNAIVPQVAAEFIRAYMEI